MDTKPKSMALQIASLFGNHQWPSVPQAKMVLDMLTTNGWKGPGSPLNGNLFGFVPTSAHAYHTKFNASGYKRDINNINLNESTLAAYIHNQYLFVPMRSDKLRE